MPRCKFLYVVIVVMSMFQCVEASEKDGPPRRDIYTLSYDSYLPREENIRRKAVWRHLEGQNFTDSCGHKWYGEYEYTVANIFDVKKKSNDASKACGAAGRLSSIAEETSPSVDDADSAFLQKQLKLAEMRKASGLRRTHTARDVRAVHAPVAALLAASGAAPRSAVAPHVLTEAVFSGRIAYPAATPQVSVQPSSTPSKSKEGKQSKDRQEECDAFTWCLAQSRKQDPRLVAYVKKMKRKYGGNFNVTGKK